jgi:hypothetical protein
VTLTIAYLATVAIVTISARTDLTGFEHFNAICDQLNIKVIETNMD